MLTVHRYVAKPPDIQYLLHNDPLAPVLYTRGFSDMPTSPNIATHRQHNLRRPMSANIVSDVPTVGAHRRRCSPMFTHIDQDVPHKNYTSAPMPTTLYLHRHRCRHSHVRIGADAPRYKLTSPPTSPHTYSYRYRLRPMSCHIASDVSPRMYASVPMFDVPSSNRHRCHPTHVHIGADVPRSLLTSHLPSDAPAAIPMPSANVGRHRPMLIHFNGVVGRCRPM